MPEMLILVTIRLEWANTPPLSPENSQDTAQACARTAKIRPDEKRS